MAVTLLLLTLGASRQSAAQTPLDWDTLFPWPRINGVRSYGIGRPGSIDVDPDLIHFDDTTRTATVTLVNPTTIPQTLWLAPECGGDGKMQPDDPLAAAWHNQYNCATPWISGYPEYLPLAPHERRTLTLRLHPYPTLRDGRYIARLMINGIGQQGGHDETAIEYVKGPTRPRRSRTRWVSPESGTLAGPRVQANTDVVVLDDTTRTATVTLTNPGATVAELWLTMDCPWFHVHYETIPGMTHKSQYEFTWHTDTPNIAAWVSGYPQHLVLAPHEQQTITLRLTPFYNYQPSIYAAGSYYAQLRYVQTPVLRVRPGGDTVYTTPAGAINLVYSLGTASRRLAMSPVQYTPRSDGTAQACVTVQQPGLGTVVMVHSELMKLGNESGLPDNSFHWDLDTTVGVWEVMHHRDPNREAGVPIIPDPMCFMLPDLHGSYQLRVSATPLGGEVTTRTLGVEGRP